MDRKGQIPRRITSANLSHLAQVQAAPALYRPMRLPTYPATERTSILKLITTDTIQVAGNKFFVICRSPAYPIWTTYQLTNLAVCYSPALGGKSYARLFPRAADGTLTLNMFNESAILTRVNYGATAAFVRYPLMVTEEGDYWFYVPPGGNFVLNVTVDQSAAGGIYALNYMRCQDFALYTPEPFSADQAGMATTTTPGQSVVQWVVTGGGWYKPTQIICGTAATTSTTPATMSSLVVGFSTAATPLPVLTSSAIVGTMTEALLPMFQAPPEFNQAPKIYQNTRLNALAVLFQNATAVLNKEGTAEAVRVPTGRTSLGLLSDLPSTVFSKYYSDTSTADRYVGLLEKGFYTFVPPDEESCAFRDCTTAGLTATTETPVMTPFFSAYCHFIKLTDLGGSESTFAVTVDTHLEFRNTTMLWDVGLTSVSLDAWQKAQIVLMKLGFFYENPTHLATIARLAASAARTAWPIVRPYAIAGGRRLLTSAVNRVMPTVLDLTKTQVQLNPARRTGPPRKKQKPVPKRQTKKHR